MSLLDPKTAAELTDLVKDYHTALVVNLFGAEVVPKEVVDRLRALGLLPPGAEYPGILTEAHALGAALAGLEDPRTGAALSLAEAREHLRRAPIPRTRVEELAAQHAALQGAAAVRGLGNKVGAHLDHTLVEADAALRRDQRALIRDAVGAKFGDADAAERMAERTKGKDLSGDFFDGQFRQTIRELKSDLGHASGDWARDLQRIAQTESHNALQHGMAERFKEQVKGQEILVYKAIRPTACKHCVRLHNDKDGNPRVYRLSDLEANGTNRGRRAADWEAVVGSVHPWCSCHLIRLPRFLEMPAGWAPGQSAPSVVGPSGIVVD